MGTTWERIFPPLVNDGNVTTFTPSTPGAHNVLIKEGMESPDDSDFIFALADDKQDRFRVPGGLTPSRNLRKIRVGIRFKGEAIPQTPGLNVNLFVGGGAWGSVAKINVDSGGVIVDGQVTFNVGPGKTTDDWNSAGVRLLWFTSKSAGSGYIPPEEYKRESS